MSDNYTTEQDTKKRKEERYNRTIFIICIILIGAFCLILGYYIGHKYTEKVLEPPKEDYITTCPFCGADNVKLHPINDSWYIECEQYGLHQRGCGLSTGYFSNKQELIDKWNTMCNKMNEENEENGDG